GKKNAAKRPRRRRCIHVSSEPILDEEGQITCMIDMSMRQNNRVDAAGLDGNRMPIALAQDLQALKESAIDHVMMLSEREKILGPCDRSRCTNKLQGCAQASLIYKNPMAFQNKTH